MRDAFDFIANNFSEGWERLYEFTQNMLESNRQRFELQKECTIQQKELDRVNNLLIKLAEILDGSTMLNTEIHFSHIGLQADRLGKDIERYSTNYQIEAIKIWLDKKSENEFDIIYRLITRVGIIYETSNVISIEIGKSEVFTGIYVELKRKTS